MTVNCCVALVVFTFCGGKLIAVGGIPTSDWICRLANAVLTAELPVPMMLNCTRLGGEFTLVLTVRVAGCPDVTDGGLKPAVKPLGSPMAEKATVCGTPAIVVVTMLNVAEFPAIVLAGFGITAMEKLFAGTPVPLREICLNPSPLPFTARVAWRSPSAAGVKVTFTVQLWPSCKVSPAQLSVSPKSVALAPLMARDAMGNGRAPTLVKVVTCAAVVMPMI